MQVGCLINIRYRVGLSQPIIRLINGHINSTQAQMHQIEPGSGLLNAL
jgi:hypothetical protein